MVSGRSKEQQEHSGILLNKHFWERHGNIIPADKAYMLQNLLSGYFYSIWEDIL